MMEIKWRDRKKDLEGYRVYNRSKQKEYRAQWLKEHPEFSLHRKDIVRKRPFRASTDEILKREGHCKFCSMLLESDYHKKHPLVGCLKYAK